MWVVVLISGQEKTDKREIIFQLSFLKPLTIIENSAIRYNWCSVQLNLGLCDRQILVELGDTHSREWIYN